MKTPISRYLVINAVKYSCIISKILEKSIYYKKV